MKRIFAVLLAVIFLLSAGPVGAVTVGFPMESSVITSDTNAAVAAHKEIYGYTWWATTAGGSFGLHDKATIAATASTDAIAEDAEATDEQTKTVWFPKPLITDNGCSVKINAGILTLYYQK